MNTIVRLLFFLTFLIATMTLASESSAAEETGESGFEIKTFEVTGNTLFTDEQVRAAVILYTGTGRTAADVEKARDALEI